jgi:hypothetical protein
MALTASEERKVIAQLFNDEKMQVALDKILAGKRLEDKAYEQLVSRAFVDRAKIGFGGATLFTLSDPDMHMRAAALMGVNDVGKSIIDDEDFIKRNLPDFLTLAKNGSESSPLMNAEICRAMVRYINDPEDMRMPEPAKQAFDSVLTNEFKKSLTQKMLDGAFSSPLSEPDTERLYANFGLKSVSIDPDELEKLNAKLNEDSPEVEAVDIPSNTDNVANNDSPDRGNATLSTDAMLQQIGMMAEKADKEARKHRLQVDAQTEAQMAINKLMDENPTWVRRTTIHKLKDKITNGTNSLLGQDPLVYPSESLFGDSLAVMDAHGRVEQTLLNYRSGPGLNKRVEFKSPSVPEEAYQLAALQVKRDGISKPHVSSNFRDPKVALAFMEKSVTALIQAGYSIDDISVDRHLQNAFENYKLEHAEPVFSIGERPEETPMQEPVHTRDVMPEEIIEAKNVEINSPTVHVADQLADIEKGLSFDDIPNEQLLPVMPLLVELANPERTWQQIQDESGLTPTGRGVVERLKLHLDSAVSKLDPESDRFSQNGPNEKAVKLIAESLNLLEPIYGKEVLNRIMPSLQQKADEIMKKEAERDEKLARAQENQQGGDPQVNNQQNNQGNVPSNNAVSAQPGDVAPISNQEFGFDPNLNGNDIPDHMKEGPPIVENDFPDHMKEGPPIVENDFVEPPIYDEFVENQYIDQNDIHNIDGMAAAPQQSVDDMSAMQQQSVDDMSAMQQQSVDDMSAMQQQSVDDINAVPQQSIDDINAVPQQSIDDMNAVPQQSIDDMSAVPQQSIDDMSAVPQQSIDDMNAVPQQSVDDMSAMPQQSIDDMTVAIHQAIDDYEANTQTEKHETPAAKELGVGSERTRVPDSWIQKLEELGWEDLTPEQVRKIPKPSEFGEDQRKTGAYTIASTVNALLNMDEFLIDTASPKEKAFIDRMPDDMLPPKIKTELEKAPDVNPVVEPEDQSEFTRRKR